MVTGVFIDDETVNEYLSSRDLIRILISAGIPATNEDYMRAREATRSLSEELWIAANFRLSFSRVAVPAQRRNNERPLPALVERAGRGVKSRPPVRA